MENQFGKVKEFIEYVNSKNVRGTLLYFEDQQVHNKFEIYDEHMEVVFKDDSCTYEVYCFNEYDETEKVLSYLKKSVKLYTEVVL